MKFIDLFAGIGGFRLGLENICGECVFSSEWDKHAQITYQANFGAIPYGDITKIDERTIPDHDVVIAGFPCQTFSVVGKREGFHDAKRRGNAFLEICRIIKHKKPRFLFLENVRGLLSHANGDSFQMIMHHLRQCGYHVKCEVLNSMDHANTPQNRERVFIMGFLHQADCRNFCFPKKIMLSKKFAECLEKNVDKKYHCERKKNYNILKKIVTQENTVYAFNFKKYHAKKFNVCNTLLSLASHVPIILQDHIIRHLTPREYANFQGFPQDYKLPHTLADSALYKQFGNSVTVPLISRIAVELQKCF